MVAIACLGLGVVLVRLLVEVQRRRTLLELARRAPAGTVVVMARTAELPAMWVRVGDGPADGSGRPHAAEPS